MGSDGPLEGGARRGVDPHRHDHHAADTAEAPTGKARTRGQQIGGESIFEEPTSAERGGSRAKPGKRPGRGRADGGASSLREDVRRSPRSYRSANTILGARAAARFGSACRARRRRHRGHIGPLVPVLTALAVLAAGFVLGGGALTASTAAGIESSLPAPGEIDSPPLQQSSVLLDSEGEEIAEISSGQRRRVVPSDRLSPDLKDAVVAIEDRRFYQHSGVDTEGIGRAAAANAAAGAVVEGGSTITQQLMKTRYLPVEERYRNTLSRKAFEASLALSYEERHTKRQILTEYLNTIYFGNGSYGADAAARTYFSKPADDLTLSESAMLAGVLNLPGYYDPFARPEAVQARRDVVLDQMLAQGVITRAEYDRATSAGLGLQPADEAAVPEELAPFVDAVRAELVRKYGLQTVESGGLRVTTTLDAEAQQRAVEAAEGALSPDSGDPSAALVSVDPDTGAVRALATNDPEANRFNLATDALRQPGSTFKAFVLTAAVNSGVSLDREYVSREMSVEWREGAPPYRVNNYRGAELGPITVQRATEVSDNSVFVQLALDVGMDAVVAAAHALGIDRQLPESPAVAIGGLPRGVSPLDMAGSYATLASGGVRHEPRFVESVERTTAEGYEPLQPGPGGGNGASRAVSQQVATTVTGALAGVVAEGQTEGFERLREDSGTELAGKTGTSENFRDAWYVGYPSTAAAGEEKPATSPQEYATSVWVGYPDSPRPMRGVAGYDRVDGSTVPLKIYADYVLASG